MWSLFKIALVIVVVFIGLGFALSSLPDANASEWGRKAAEYGIKGARGSKVFFSAMAREVKGQPSEAEAEAE